MLEFSQFCSVMRYHAAPLVLQFLGQLPAVHNVKYFAGILEFVNKLVPQLFCLKLTAIHGLFHLIAVTFPNTNIPFARTSEYVIAVLAKSYGIDLAHTSIMVHVIWLNGKSVWECACLGNCFVYALVDSRR